MSSPIDLTTIADCRVQLNLPPQGLGNVILTNPGSGYLTPPDIAVVPVDGNGSGGTVTATLDGFGQVLSLLITAPGKGYTADPQLSFSGGGGTGAAATAYIGDDLNLSKLITSMSQRFLTAVSRDIFATDYVEVRDGKNHFSMVLRNLPVISVTSVTIDTVDVPKSPDGLQAGWVNDDQAVKLVARGPLYTSMLPWATSLVLCGWVFPRGFQNIIICYRGGYDPVPADISYAVTEWVAQRVYQRLNQDQRSKSLAGESVSYGYPWTTKSGNGGMPDFVSDVVSHYKNRGWIE
jgi:hypothetical protein